MYDRVSEDGRPLILHCHRTWTDPCDCGDGAHPDGHRRTDDHMPELEDTMATYTGAAGEKSPDRLDSLVWAASRFLRETFGIPGIPGKREWAGQQALSDVTGNEEDRMMRRMREVHERAAEHIGDAPWDLDGFSPGDPEEQPQPRGNVRSWGSGRPGYR
jgi:hypothetical protein